MDQRTSREPFPPSLSGAERQAALSLVRRAVEAFVQEGRRPDLPSQPPIPRSPRSVFVTLTRRGQLRGCIGVLEPTESLPETLVHCAVAAATEDRRFAPVTPAELPELRYEISILSPLRETCSPNEIEVGHHGILIEVRGRRGLLLPQVASEHGWDRDTFLDQVCLKAGLAPSVWRAGSRIWIFTAEVFGEVGP